MKQRTIKDPVELKGPGLQTGIEAKLRARSAPADSGIQFVRVDLPGAPALRLSAIELGDTAAHERRTTIAIGPLQIQTTEHLLAALSILAIDNIIFELDSAELPGLDGSAKDFIEAIKRAGIIEQDRERSVLQFREPVWCSDRDAFLAVFPDDLFRISYTLHYAHPAIGTQFMSIAMEGDRFEREIASARTFCLEEEALALLAHGLGKGANYENTLVIGKDGPLKTKLRFPDEPVRHKVLDLIGDLYMLGQPIKGHVVAIRSGHKLNMELVRRLKAMSEKRR